MSPQPLILASASPRRAELLAAAGIEFEVVPADIDERVHPDEKAAPYVRRMARTKAHAVRTVWPGRLILAADTVVVVEGEVLGKPRDLADAAAMLDRLGGRTHRVLTGVALLAGEREWLDVAQTTVQLAPLSEEEIEWYVASGEPFDKAGAYAVQGLASRFVRAIDGSYSNVVGLPVALVYQMLCLTGRRP